MRPPHDRIFAPGFPEQASWINVAMLRMDKLLGRPVLVEFWDFCRVNSLRTLPYVRAWHEKYPGLRVVSVHAGGFPPSRDTDNVRAAVARLDITHPVMVDEQFVLWDHYGNRGWPARYLWTKKGRLFSYHYGEGAYDETELEIQQLLGLDEPLVEPVRREDAPGALLPAQSEDRPGAYCGPYAAGGVHAVLEGAGTVTVNDETRVIEYTGCHLLLEHDRHTEGVLDLRIGEGLTCYATLFTPGVA